MSYPWEVSIANPLLKQFASVGMPPTDIVEEPDQDPVLSGGIAQSDPEDGADTHCIDPSFRDGLKKIVNFEVNFSFKWNYRVVIPSPSDTADNPPLGCVVVYLEALELDLQFPLPKVCQKVG